MVINNCWICGEGDKESDSMEFDMEFDTFVHSSCLEVEGVDSVLEYERQRDGDHEIKSVSL